ncbi:MAG TPA: cyclic nucleotide-binding domain-containing protein [Candidatus Angelobacter sp.]|nr:cyclic nucleotide-binding domain-containing protein [Candidatus Angelobacter sp.]
MTSIDAINDLHAGVSDEVRAELAECETVATVPRGTRLVEAGIAPSHLIILNSGSAETCVQANGKTTSLGIMGPGRVFGLHSVLSGEIPQTTVTCLENCKIRRVPREAFKCVLDRHPEMYIAVVKVLSADLAVADHLLRKNARAFKVRPGRRSSKHL